MIRKHVIEDDDNQDEATQIDGKLIHNIESLKLFDMIALKSFPASKHQ
jgi:hypothetical protein